MKVVILAAGKGIRFNSHIPKPLIEFGGKTMLQWVLSDIKDVKDDDIIVVTQKSFGITGRFRTVNLEGFTEGPACSAIKALDLVDSSEELFVINCDQRMLDFRPFDISKFAKINDLSGVLGVFYSTKPHNSYVNIDQDNLIAYVKEKRVISNVATTGVHYWRKSSFFKDSCLEMMENEDRVNGEFYISQTFNYLINKGHKVGPYYSNMHFPIGVPEDLNNFIRLGI